MIIISDMISSSFSSIIPGNVLHMVSVCIVFWSWWATTLWVIITFMTITEILTTLVNLRFLHCLVIVCLYAKHRTWCLCAAQVGIVNCIMTSCMLRKQTIGVLLLLLWHDEASLWWCHKCCKPVGWCFLHNLHTV